MGADNEALMQVLKDAGHDSVAQHLTDHSLAAAPRSRRSKQSTTFPSPGTTRDRELHREDREHLDHRAA